MSPLQILSLIACVCAGILIGTFINKFLADRRIGKAKKLSEQIVEEAKKERQARIREAELEGKDLLYRIRMEFDKETKARRDEIQQLEKRLIQREENLDKKVEVLDRKERDLNAKGKEVAENEKKLEIKSKDLDRLINEEKSKLQSLSGLTADQARKVLFSRMEAEVRQESGAMIRRIMEETKEQATRESRKILSLAIQRCAADHTVESTVSVVNLPNDDMKGRIIGREGRNIRALETATGVDVIVDDTPEAVILSGFDPVRREIARIVLERLLVDGRIHPARIEEITQKVKEEMDENIRQEGEKAAAEMGIHGLHPKLVETLGRLRYRTSYGQNVLQHSKEVAYIAGVIASELGLDFKLARRAGLLHDIGKAVDQDVEGTHVSISVELLRKYGESEEIIHAVEAHHEDVEATTPLAIIISASDSVSGARPGARRETLENYVKRLQKLEQIADSFKGVSKSYAIQAGREVRVIVIPERITDDGAYALAREITSKIEQGLEYPGQVKVTVIRETRAVEYAK